MATTTEKGFKIPGYADKADVPGMVKTMWKLLNNTSKPFQNQCQTYHPILIH